ncbi:MAG: Hsp20 family protein [Cryomorphaceae bacterium]|nr:Hsp20 family protein [Cryomorphaceae bacterium]
MTLVKYRTPRTSVFNTFFDDVVARDLFFKGLPKEESSIIPAANVKELENGYEIELAIPGFSKSEINIELSGNVLTFSAKKEKEEAETEGKYTFREFSSKAFSRSFSLPKNIRTSDISAHQEHGILTITLPKEAPAQPQVKKIEIL